MLQLASRQATLISLAILMFSCPAPAQETVAGQNDAKKQDLERFQGKWSLVVAERDGKKMTQEEIQKFKLSIQGDEFILEKNGVVVSKGTFKLNPIKKPKEIDETITTGPNKGKVFLAIYEVGDEQHTVCFSAPGKERPTAFASTTGSGRLLQVWKRDKK